MMVQAYVRMANLVNRLKQEEKGLTAIEYGVFAAFIVLALSVAAFTLGPKLSTWMNQTICSIIKGGSSTSC